VPAEVEHELRARAAAENTTISAILTEAAEREMEWRRRAAIARRWVEETVAADGAPTGEQQAQLTADLDAIDAHFADLWAHDPHGEAA
jgi:hypothetical protein